MMLQRECLGQPVSLVVSGPRLGRKTWPPQGLMVVVAICARVFEGTLGLEREPPANARPPPPPMCLLVFCFCLFFWGDILRQATLCFQVDLGCFDLSHRFVQIFEIPPEALQDPGRLAKLLRVTRPGHQTCAPGDRRVAASAFF